MSWISWMLTMMSDTIWCHNATISFTHINSFSPGKCIKIFKNIILYDIFCQIILHIYSKIAPVWDANNLKSPLVQVMAWCHQATSHYLSQWWPRLYVITRPQWVNKLTSSITWKHYRNLSVYVLYTLYNLHQGGSILFIFFPSRNGAVCKQTMNLGVTLTVLSCNHMG